MTQGFTVEVYDCGERTASLYTTSVKEDAEKFAADLRASFETAFPIEHKYHDAYEVLVTRTFLDDEPPTTQVLYYAEYTEWDSLSAKKGVIEVIPTVVTFSDNAVNAFAAPYYVSDFISELVDIVLVQRTPLVRGARTDADYMRRRAVVGKNADEVYKEMEQIIATNVFGSDNNDDKRKVSIIKHKKADTFLAELLKDVLDKSGVPSR